MSYITVENLSKTFTMSKKSLTALNNFNLEISEKKIIGIVGPSGCGKTTLLKIIAGLVEPTKGTVKIDNKTPKEYRKNGGIGFVFQKPLLFPWRNLKKNLLLPIEIKNKNSIAKIKKCEDLINLVGLSGFDEFYPHEISGGMMQRAAVARALIHDPQLLLLDEPFNSVDEITREQLWYDFRCIWTKQNLTAIMVTHNIREAIFFSDEIFVMSKLPGKIINHFKVDYNEPRKLNILTQPNFLKLYEKIRSDII